MRSHPRSTKCCAGTTSFVIGNEKRAERKKCYDRFQEILAEDQPYTFLYVPEELIISSNRIRGVEPAPIGIGHNFIKWYVPKDEQKYTMTQ
jgi:peptide/nickel transport system substrate-binding protein